MCLKTENEDKDKYQMCEEVIETLMTNIVKWEEELDDLLIV